MTVDEPVDSSGRCDRSRRLSTPAEGAALSEMLGVLSQQTERRILFHLLHHEGRINVESLAAQVASTDASSPPDPPNGTADRKQVGSR